MTNWPGSWTSRNRSWTRSGRSWEKKEAHCAPSNPADVGLGDCWDHVALDAVSKFAVAVVPGKRTVESTRQLVEELAERTDHRLPRLFTTDEYKPYQRVLLETYGQKVARPRRPGPGRPPSPRLVAPEELVYATVHKHRRKGKVVEVTIHRVFGTAEQVEEALANSPVSDHINTAFVERYNGTDRHLNSRKGRKVYRFSKDPELHKAMTHYSQTIYNFCRPNRALTQNLADHRRWARTPAMAIGLTDHVWSVAELARRQACPP